MRIGIDATNIGGGGGITHLKEILSHFDENYFKESISKIIVFSSQKVLDELPNLKILDKITSPLLNQGLLKRIIFQSFYYDKIISKKCDILLSLTGDYIGKFNKVVGMSRNMLLYETDIWKEINDIKETTRFKLIYKKQKRCFKKALGVIFISDYAKKFISEKIDLKTKKTVKINHGISTKFEGKIIKQKHITDYTFETPYRLLYVSTVHVYKHQWNVVRAIGLLRKEGFPVELNLIGGIISKYAGEKLLKTIEDVDSKKEFIRQLGHIPYQEIEKYYKNTDGIIFASTCENMPNILLEAMASGNPVCCSNKQPMPEFLKQNGFYFDSYNIESIKTAVKKMLLNPEEREMSSVNNLNEINNYSWENTSKLTFQFLVNLM